MVLRDLLKHTHNSTVIKHSNVFLMPTDKQELLQIKHLSSQNVWNVAIISYYLVSIQCSFYSALKLSHVCIHVCSHVFASYIEPYAPITFWKQVATAKWCSNPDPFNCWVQEPNVVQNQADNTISNLEPYTAMGGLDSFIPEFTCM